MITSVVGAVYVFTEVGSQPLDYFVRLADAFLHGHIYLSAAPSWLNELVPARVGWYVPYPPMPALVLLPFVAILGPSVPEQTISCLVAAIGVGFMSLALGRLGVRGWTRLGLVAVFAFGTVLWWASAEGSAWTFAQAVAVTFSAAALLVAADRRWPILVGVLLGCATISRLPVGLSAPFYLALVAAVPLPLTLADVRRTILPATWFAIGLAIPLLPYALYNVARWGTPLDMGYALIPGVLQDPIYAEHGILSIFYIPRHIYAILLRSFDLQADFPWFRPSWWGLSLFITTPLYVWLARAPGRDPRVRWAVVGIGLALIPIVTHGNVGIAQWGYRFSLDVQVPLFALLGLALVRYRGPDWRPILAGALAVAVNIYGIVAIRSGFVGY